MGLTPYEKKRYRESKKRRRQAILESETGRIIPYRNRKKIVIIILSCFCALIIAAFVITVAVLNGNNNEETVSVSSNELTNDELLRVVNRLNPLGSDYVPDLEEYGSVKLNPVAASSLKEMTTLAKNQGIELKVKKGFVSFQEQETLFSENLAKFTSNSKYTPVRAQAAAKRIVPEAGCCESQTGLLVEFVIPDSKTNAFLERECINYGYILRFPDGKEDITHLEPSKSLYRYVGKENAEKMRSFDMCLEEYSDYISIN